MSPDTHFVRASIFPIKQLLASLLLLCVAAPSIRSAVADPDILYVGDGVPNKIRRFDAKTGSPISGGSSSARLNKCKAVV
jgi:hypothetical protein